MNGEHGSSLFNAPQRALYEARLAEPGPARGAGPHARSTSRAAAEEAAGQGGPARHRGHPREAGTGDSTEQDMTTSFTTREGAKIPELRSPSTGLPVRPHPYQARRMSR